MNALEHKVPPPIVLLLVAVLMWALAYYTPAVAFSPVIRWIFVVGFLIIAFGFAPPAILAFRRTQTTIDPVHIDRASALVTTGPFSYSRNPMYVGLTALLLAWMCYLAAPWTVLGPIFFVLFITRFQIVPEERAMRAKFGQAYEDYCQRVRRWI
jgi:protein-S-isoprenylcysteine O-methyltransferase Ste14